jgi:hypothetical protein
VNALVWSVVVAGSPASMYAPTRGDGALAGQERRRVGGVADEGDAAG